MARLLIFCFVVLFALAHSTQLTFTTEAVGSTESTFTVKPIVSAEPTFTVKPIASTEPTFTVKPIGSTKPAFTVKPIVSAKPTLTVKPIASTEPTFTVKPIGSTEPTFTVKPIGSAKPTFTAKPIASTEPTFTVRPIGSTEPTFTVKPIVSPEPRTVVTEAASNTSNGATTKIPTNIVFSSNMAPYSAQFSYETMLRQTIAHVKKEMWQASLNGEFENRNSRPSVEENTKSLNEGDDTKNGIKSDQCVKLLPGLDRMTKGIDVTTLDLFPADIAQSAGYRQTIFDFTCAKKKTWSHPSFSEETFSVPDQIQTISKAPAGSLNIRTKFNENIEEMKESMAVKVDIDISHSIGSFSASAGYKDAKEKMLQSNKSVAETSATISSIEVDLKSPRNVKLSSYFARSIAKLPAKYEMDPEKYDMLINIFGTHYFEVAKFGGYLYQKTIIENKYLSETKQEDISANLKLSFNSFFSLGVNMNAEFNQISNSSKATFAMNTQKNFYNYGGTTKFSTDPDKNYVAKWWDTINRNPWLFGGQLKPIENLILDPAIRQEVAKATLLKRIRAYLRDFRTSVDLTTLKLTQKSDQFLNEIHEYLNGNSPSELKTILSRGKDIKEIFDKFQNLQRNLRSGESFVDNIFLNANMYLLSQCQSSIPNDVPQIMDKIFKCKNAYFKMSKKQIKPNQIPNSSTSSHLCAYKKFTF